MYCSYGNFVSVRSGKSNGRSFTECLTDGHVTITGMNKGVPFKRLLTIENGEIWDNKEIINNRTVHHIVYGEYEKKGKDIVRFRKGTGMGKHGKARREEKLFGHDGVCHSWYNRGRLARQKFVYDNNKTAYDYNGYNDECIVKDYDGNILYELKGAFDGKFENAYRGCHSILARPMDNWFVMTKPFQVKKNGKMFFKGEVNNYQKIGEWVIDGKYFFYVNGVQIPKKLYNTPPEKLNVLEILKLDNSQLRMAMMEKIGPDKIAKHGKVIHKDGDMRLYDIKGYDVRILRVRCTTTKAYYFLRVPKDAKKCEPARQWTFGVGEYLNKPIKFEVET